MAHWATTDEMGAAVRMKNKKYDVCEVRKMLSQKLNLLGEEFIQKVRASTVDTSINTVDNKLDLDDLKALEKVQMEEGSTNRILYLERFS